jgi:hypothetical protein
MTNTTIIGWPIYEGCFVRLRNGQTRGPISQRGGLIWVWTDGEDDWKEAGQWTKSEKKNPADIIEVLPKPFTAAPEPSYEQKLWDEAALRMLGGLQPSAEAASKTADDFMVERAKRMKP